MLSFVIKLEKSANKTQDSLKVAFSDEALSLQTGAEKYKHFGVVFFSVNSMPHYTVTLHALHYLSFSFTINFYI